MAFFTVSFTSRVWKTLLPCQIISIRRCSDTTPCFASHKRGLPTRLHLNASGVSVNPSFLCRPHRWLDEGISTSDQTPMISGPSYFPKYHSTHEYNGLVQHTEIKEAKTQKEIVAEEACPPLTAAYLGGCLQQESRDWRAKKNKVPTDCMSADTRKLIRRVRHARSRVTPGCAIGQKRLCLLV